MENETRPRHRASRSVTAGERAPWALGRRAALDGVRGVACLLVLVTHMVISETTRFLGGGGAGVTVFFTLSGFLITALLLEERDRTGRTSLGAFYLRRTRRLVPALVAYVAVVLGLAQLLGSWFAGPRAAAWSLLYVSNWRMIAGELLGALSQTWSLAIEEQFYLLWPLVLVVVLRRFSETVLLGVTVVGIATSVYLSHALWADGVGLNRVYFGSDTRAGAILLGCAAALVVRRLGAGRGRPWIATALVLAAVPLGFVTGMKNIFVWMPLLVAGLTAVALVLGTRGDWGGLLSSRVLGWVGKRAYGLYLWHYAAVTALAGSGLPWRAWAPIYVVVTLVAATLSWRFVEQPFLRPRPGRATQPVAPAAPAAPVVALAEN